MRTTLSVSFFTRLHPRPELSDESTDGTYNNVTASHGSKITSSSSPWQHLSSWPEGSSTNLCPPTTYTTHRSSAATHSQHSDSAWETDASPSADDYDMRPMPDENSASMQSYNDPQAGIWLQEGTYGPDPTYSIITGMRHDNGINSTVTQTLRPSLRQVLDDVDAAMPTGTEAYRSGAATFPNASTSADGRQERAHSSLPMPSTGGIFFPQLSPNPFDRQSRVSIGTNGVEASLVQQHLEIEHHFYTLGSDQIVAQNISPMIVRDDTSLPATQLPHNRPTGRPAPVLTPSTSADASATGVAICPHRGCHKRFTGSKREDTLRRHKRLGHGNKPKPVCPVCGHVFESGRPDNLKRHILGKHPDQPLPALRNVRTRESVHDGGFHDTYHEPFPHRPAYGIAQNA